MKAFNIRNVYRTDEEIKELKQRIIRDISEAKQYSTPDSKRKVLRLTKFLSELR